MVVEGSRRHAHTGFMQARLVSLQVGLPREHATFEGLVVTGLVKEAVWTPVELGVRALAGDGCADLVHHGLEDQAVCVMPAAHYRWWRKFLQKTEGDFPYGSFGENFTVEGTDESQVFVGDQWRLGEALLEVTKARVPCHTLNRIWGRKDFSATMGRRGVTGWYLRVLEPGLVAAGQTMELVHRSPDAISVAASWAQKRANP